MHAVVLGERTGNEHDPSADSQAGTKTGKAQQKKSAGGGTHLELACCCQVRRYECALVSCAAEPKQKERARMARHGAGIKNIQEPAPAFREM
mmetsp:Transcript_21702/g.46063  ORF Transcript_21702/g.46063 Transcript_21702/m.46063 type:complete len:92 (+) Transcript_21702:702-977(+)